MAIAIHEEGTKNFSGDVGDTWDPIQTTDPNDTDGVFQVSVALNNMAAGDVLEVQVQVKDAASGTLRTVAGIYTRSGAQPASLVFMFTAANQWSFQMRQRSGTGRSYAWSILKVT